MTTQTHKTDPSTIFRTGHNLPGCLPDSDDAVFATLDWESARDSLLEELERTAEEVCLAAEDANLEPDPDRVQELKDTEAECDAARKALAELEPGSDFQVYIDGRSYWLEGSAPVDDEEARRAALAHLEDVSLSDVEKATWGDYTYEIGRSEFQVMDDDEADDACAEYIRESVWAFNASFLCHYVPEGLGEEEIESLRGDRCEDANQGLVALIEAGSGMEDFISDAVSADGRGHFLNHYDGEERESGDFFIYQTN